MNLPETVAPAPPFPRSLQDVATRVEARIDELLAAEIDRWSEVANDLDAPLTALRELVTAGGKRLRPAFCTAAYVGAGGDARDPALLDAAAALELVHTFALVHDDVMDGSERRRGDLAVHERFIRRHIDETWHGEARRFGEGIAILVGDFAAVYADRLMRGAPEEALQVFDELRVELCVGQALDLTGTARPGADIEMARTVTRFKSAKYTVERPLHLGAALVDRLGDLEGQLSLIGQPLGEAFQLRDDLLGVFGDPLATGKPVGADVREGKATPLLALASARADGDGRRLLSMLGDPDLDDRELERAQDLIVSTGAVSALEAEISRLVDQAGSAIDDAPITVEARALLHALSSYVAWRDR